VAFFAGRKICLMGLVSRFIPLLPKAATKIYRLLLMAILVLTSVFYVVAYYFSQHVPAPRNICV
jgi:hypothetical protein